MKPKISVVTISFNQKAYLRRCIDSVLYEKDEHLEYIVVDPGSTDGSQELIESYGNCIDQVIFEADDGPADGLNKGFRRATGDIGYFINSDDFLLPGAIRRMQCLWQGFPELDVLLGGAWMVNEDGNPLRELRASQVTLEELLSGDASIIQQGMSFRLNTFSQLGGFNPVNRTCWDYELLCAMLHAGASVHSTQERFGVFRLHEASLSGGVNGSSHTHRYQADLDRIRLSLTGLECPKAQTPSGLIGKAYRHANRPGMTIRLMSDKLFPANMRRRWRSDFGEGVDRS